MKRWEELSEAERTPEAGYAEALRRIEEAGKYRAKALNLIALQLKEIPPEVGTLTGLTQLLLYRNHIQDLTPLKGLDRLTELRISTSQIKDLTPIQSLGQLKLLILDNNQIRNLAPLQKLTQLRGLWLRDNNIDTVAPLQSLKKLSQLFLDKNQIHDLNPLQNLHRLKRLSIEKNQFHDLTPLQNLTYITELSLANNPTYDFAPLQYLSRLNRLSISSNQPTDLSLLSDLHELEWLFLCDFTHSISILPLASFLRRVPYIYFDLSLFKGLHLHDTTLSDPPEEIARQGAETTLRYWNAVDTLGTLSNREGRILLVGHGKAGKTSLQRKLEDEETLIPSPEGEFKPTIGVEVCEDIPFPHEGTRYAARVWDFGGQEEQHMTHQYFFGRRSLYIVVIDQRTQSDYEYWLRMINVFGQRPGGEKTPVILLFNEKNWGRVPQKHFGQDTWRHYDRLEPIPLSVDLGRNEGQDNDTRWATVRAEIGRQLAALPVMTDILKPYVQLPEALEAERLAGRPHLSFARFGEICTELGLEFAAMHRDAALYLHAIGEVLYYGDTVPALADYVIIDPSWATEALYAVLKLPHAQANGGRFTQAELEGVWRADYSATDRELLTKLLLQDAFELCYRLPAGGDFDFLAPILLSEVETGLDWLADKHEVLRLRFHYDGVLPPGIMTRLIVRLHHRLSGQRHYRYGAVFFDSESDRTALIKVARRPQPELSIEIDGIGNAATAFLNELRRYVLDLHRDFSEDLQVDEEFACCCEQCRELPITEKTYYDRRKLIARLNKGRSQVYCDQLEDDISLVELLHGIYTSTDRELLEKINERGMRHSGRLAALEETVVDSNERVRDAGEEIRAIHNAVLSVKYDLDTIKGDYFVDAAEQRRYFARVEAILDALPADAPERPDPDWPNRPLKNKIKIGIDMAKLLSTYTGIELDGLSLKWERELDTSGARLPRNWGEFKGWFLDPSS